MATRPKRDLALEQPEEFRPLGPRPDDAHLSSQDVPELRKLVDVALPQQPSGPSDPRIVVGSPTRCAGQFRPLDHRTELDDLERLSALAESDLPEQNRTTARKAND